MTATNGEGVDELVAATVVEALGEAMNEDELDGVAGLVAVTDADVPLERVAVGVNVRVNDDVAVLDGDAPRLSDAVAVCVSVLLLKRDGVVEKVGVSDGDAPRDSDAVSDNDRVAVVVAVAVGVIVGVDPRLSDAVDVGVPVALLEPVGVRVAFCVPVSDGVGDGLGVTPDGTQASSVALPGAPTSLTPPVAATVKRCHVAPALALTKELPPPPLAAQ